MPIQAFSSKILNPEYQSFIGKKVFIPDTNIQIPVISDNYVDINFGTGVVKK
ncbi:hypothetical protein ACEW7V_00145 [Areca yellow leaf disease phytoplasma]|uniref:hypothetical protein n=1 Tax=Areca yellow leaf disease phytoplasma TaxID=927614 RepID=UPI0035B55B5F